MSDNDPVPRSTSGIRLATVRRLYFYIVTLISLLAGLYAIDDLITVLAEVWLAGSDGLFVAGGDFLRNTIARSGGILLVATPIFLLHWRAIQQRQNDPEERSAALRKLFLYVVQAVLAFYALVNTYDLLSGMIELALGGSLDSSPIYPAAWLSMTAKIMIGGLLYTYFQHILIADGDYGSEVGLAGTWRRLYQSVVGLISLALLLFGLASMFEVFWHLAVDLATGTAGGVWWRSQLSDAAARAGIGGALLWLNWRRWQSITTEYPAESTSALRRLYLYAAVVISALMTLIPVATMLREMLLLVFGATTATNNEIWYDLTTPLAAIPVGLVSWIWYWRYLQGEAAARGESREGATVRRIYYYAVAATGLALLWYGATETLGALLDALLLGAGNRPATQSRIWAEPLATGISLLAVGAPIWVLHWQAVQRVATRDDASGREERRSTPRRIYLYGIALVGAVLILIHLAQVTFRLLLYLLGDPSAGLFFPQTANEIAGAAIAAIFWTIHILAIRRDTGMDSADAHEEVAADAGRQRAELTQRIAALEAELLQARTRLAALEEPSAE